METTSPKCSLHISGPQAVRIVLRLVCLTLVAIVPGCGEGMKDGRPETVTVDFRKHLHNASEDTIFGKLPLRVAVSSMISPRETFNYYQDLVRYLGSRLDRPVEFKQRKTYRETNALIERSEVDVAFICSGAYVEAKDKGQIELLAVPVSHGRPHYRAYILANRVSGITSLERMRGHRFAFTDPLSHTGYIYTRERVRQLRSTIDDFFTESFFTYAHDNSIRLVDKGIVDGASVDGLIYDYFVRYFPDRVRNVRVIERSDYFGIPPVVVPVSSPDSLVRRLRGILCHMHEDPQGMEILEKLMIDRFIEGRDEEYNSIREFLRTIR